MDTDKFIDKSRLKHDNKYDYSLSVYTNCRTKLKIRCNTCQVIFEQKPYHHIGGQGCKQCVIFNMRLTTAQFIERSKEIHWDSFDYTLTKYIDYKTKIQSSCKICNTICEQFPGSHLRGSGCRMCSINNITCSREEFINKAKNIHNNRYDYSLVEYINSKTKVKIKCNECESIFEQLPYSHMVSNCLNCENIKKRKTWLDFKTRASLIHDNKYDYQLSEYINSTTTIKIICKQCHLRIDERKWYSSVWNFSEGNGS